MRDLRSLTAPPSLRRADRLTAALVLAGLLAAPAVGAQDALQQQRQRTYNLVKPAVVLLEVPVRAEIHVRTPQGMYRTEISRVGGGSGWIITPDGYLVTNGHVVASYHEQNEEQTKIDLFVAAMDRDVLPSIEAAQGRRLQPAERMRMLQQLYDQSQIALHKELNVVLQNGDRYSGEVKQYSPGIQPLPGRISLPGHTAETGKDVAIVKIEARDLPTVRIGDSDRLGLGDDVVAAGYPGVVADHMYLGERTQLEPTFTRGQVSGMRVTVAGAEVIQTDAPLTWGNSGGPIFDSRGEVVGMATFISLRQVGEQVQPIHGFNFAVPTSTVLEFVRAEGIMPRPGTFDRHWTRALDLYYSGRYAESVAAFDDVLRVLDRLPTADALRRTAMARRDELPPPRAPVRAWVIFGAVGLGVILIGGGLAARRMGRGDGLATPPAEPAGTAAPAPPPSPRGPGHLVVVEGPLRGNRFPIPVTGLKIGRDPSACQVVLSEPGASREHAALAPSGRDSEIVMRNLSGTNPTFVNDRPVQEATLKPGDRIKIATTVLTFERE